MQAGIASVRSHWEGIDIGTSEIILILLIGLQIKHVCADYFLQAPFMLRNKGKYGHVGGLSHAGIHAFLSLCLIVIFGVPFGIAAIYCLVEFVVHYHIDWVKEFIGRRFSTDPKKRQFWMVHGVDQAAHQLTYIAMVWCLVSQNYLG